jgi:hypothetical protein
MAAIVGGLFTTIGAAAVLIDCKPVIKSPIPFCRKLNSDPGPGGPGGGGVISGNSTLFAAAFLLFCILIMACGGTFGTFATFATFGTFGTFETVAVGIVIVDACACACAPPGCDGT